MEWNERKVILDLCGGTGAWSAPYREAGYDVIVIDPIQTPDVDVRLFQYCGEEIHGILCAPPCDHFASSGARWWKGKGIEKLFEGLSVVDACMRIVVIHKPKWWALENPVGRLRKYLGNPALIFNPCDYGDPWTKKTLLWGKFNMPEKTPVEPSLGSKMHRMPSSWKEQRSITPPGFAKAFFEANP